MRAINEGEVWKKVKQGNSGADDIGKTVTVRTVSVDGNHIETSGEIGCTSYSKGYFLDVFKRVGHMPEKTNDHYRAISHNSVAGCLNASAECCDDGIEGSIERAELLLAMKFIKSHKTEFIKFLEREV